VRASTPIRAAARSRTPRVLAAALAAAATMIVGGGPSVAATPVAATRTEAPASVGVMFHGMWQFYSDEQRVRVLDRMRGAGVDSVRLDVSWAMLQPAGAGSYDEWGVGFVDQVIDMVNSHGMKPLVLLWMTPGWANGYQGEHTLPTNPADFARVARWAAARYGTRVMGWEVWNEQNSPDFLDGADPVAYTRLLKAAYPAFKAGSPNTPVIFGGVQYNDVDWIRRAYDAGAKGYFDVLATHPYMGIADRAPETPDDGTRWTLAHVRAVHEEMVARGDGAKKIWFTELGWSTHANDPGTADWGLGVTEARQADYLRRAVSHTRATFPYVTRMYWYNERDLPWGGQHVMNYGLLRTDLSAKPALAALAAANGTAGGG